MKTTLALLLILTSISTYAMSLSCDNGAMTFTDHRSWPVKGWYEMIITDDKVVNYFTERIGTQNDSFKDVVLKYDAQKKDIIIIMSDFTLSYETAKLWDYEAVGRNFGYLASLNGTDMLIKITDTYGESFEYLFENCK